MSTTRRPRRRTRASMRLPQQESNDDLVDDVIANTTCIDLTEDDDPVPGDNVSIVDLTSVNDSPIVVLGREETPSADDDNGPSPRRRRRLNRQRQQDASILELPSIEPRSRLQDSIFELPDLDDDADDLPTYGLGSRTPKPGTSASGSSASGANNKSIASLSGDDSIESSPDAKKTISCPVCLESAKNISRRKNQLMSTTCGHVFCKNCITASIKAQHKCPTCRTKLSLKQIHPLFL
ncbi:unnamed protein product [Owenia fusiformis]|uniref:RING-type domain-containing protein n=1 Tax=Owenia fusiformis TaxID=6347 RepID=A0A8S4NRE8_OWEFU|nr:unnamed protein product [Owenia fusiformis]